MKSWPKAKLGQVQVGLNIVQNHLFVCDIFMVDHDVKRLICSVYSHGNYLP